MTHHVGEKHRPRRLVLEERSVGERRVEWIGEMDLSLWKLFHSYQLGVTLLINLSIPTHPFSTLRMIDWLFTCISDVFDTMSTDSSFHTHSMSQWRWSVNKSMSPLLPTSQSSTIITPLHGGHHTIHLL